MQKSTRKYRKETPWGTIEIEETSEIWRAEIDNDKRSDAVNLGHYKDKYPSESNFHQTLKTIASVTVKAVCFLGAILGIFKFMSSG